LKATCGPSSISARYPRSFSMTTPPWRWLASSVMASGRRHAFSELQSQYLFAEKFGRPGKGNDKGTVENLVGYARRNFMMPVPRASGWEELNAHLEADCGGRRERRLRGHTETIGERFQRDRAAMLPLPATPFEPFEKREG
jgi:transposase